MSENTVEVTVPVNEVLNALDGSEWTVEELETIAQKAQSLADESEARYAKLFDLGDEVQTVDGDYAIVVRRNKWTVTLADKAGNTRKVTPSTIARIVTPAEDDNFDYFDYFGTELVEADSE